MNHRSHRRKGLTGPARVLLPVLGLGLVLTSPASGASAGEVSFNRDIRPLLAENCWSCHGPAAQKASLRLDVPRGGRQPAKSGAVPIVPGDPARSELITRIHALDDAVRMPPPDSGKSLTPAQRELLRRWIATGARFEQHWAYTPLQRPPVPGPRGLNPIDAFVRERLRATGLEPSPPADLATQLRRLSLDLLGLPPNPADLAAWLAAPTEWAWSDRVRAWLDSRAHAEKQTQQWLDLVRYADTTGFHGDQDLSLWPYRDWVLRAFRDNLRFDHFTRAQLAGDLLPGATSDEQVATAFNRLNRITAEGGAQDREYLAKYAADRVRTVGMAWLGSTVGCAECHDHKFDPFTTRDFYRLAAFFADVEEKGFYGGGFSNGEWGPRLELPTTDQARQLAEIEAGLAAVRADMQAVTDRSLADGRREWEARLLALDREKRLNWLVAQPLTATSSGGATMKINGGMVSVGGHNPDHETYTLTFRPGPGRWASMIVHSDVDEELPGNRFGRGWRSHVLTGVEVEVAEPGGTAKRGRFTGASCAQGGQSSRFPAGAAIDDDPSTGWAAEFSHSSIHKLVLHLAEPLATGTNTMLTVRLRHESPVRRATLGKFLIGLSPVEGATEATPGITDSELTALRLPPGRRSKEQEASLVAAHRRGAPEMAALRLRETRLMTRRELTRGGIAHTLVTRATAPRPMRILPRGNWMDSSGEIVTAAVPGFLQSPGSTVTNATRLDLAAWLTSPANPLTARVVVNRLWRQYFGQGLCRSVDDVGSQGEWPSHPELLDWLASEFIEPRYASTGTHPWDLRHVIRLIVSSETYRQSSLPRADLAERDAANRLLGRQVPWRLDAEAIRDQALVLSGLLDPRWGGPSVFPVQPDGYWTPLNYPKREYATSFGPDQHRRSLYTHWQRTFLHPTLLAFDAVTREECAAARQVSNTPLQALVTLNDPIFVEAARGLAERVSRMGRSLDEQAAEIFRLATGRPPGAAERDVLQGLLAERLAAFRRDPGAARRWLTVGDQPPAAVTPELGAMMAVARAVLNLHETITRD